jgi:fatty acid desaturase
MAEYIIKPARPWYDAWPENITSYTKRHSIVVRALGLFCIIFGALIVIPVAFIALWASLFPLMLVSVGTTTILFAVAVEDLT